MQRSSPEATDLAACRALMRGGSRSFFAASLLLPRRVHEPASALYAFCRLADDAIDEVAGKGAALLTLRDRLERAYAGAPLPIAADRAFAAVVSKYAIPQALPEALLEGFGWDAQGRRYEDFADLQDYAARVAGTVGAMMAVLMGAREANAIARACDLGVAMQLTNIARDVGEDAREGRLYLPLAWLREAGVDPQAFLARPVFSKGIGSVVERLLQSAEFLYARSVSGIGALPPSCRPGIRAAGLIYADIGRRIARQRFDTVTQRAHVPGRRKTVLLARSLTAILKYGGDASAPALTATRYLVDAASVESTPHARQRDPIRALEGRVAWVFDLMERLQEHQEGLP